MGNRLLMRLTARVELIPDMIFTDLQMPHKVPNNVVPLEHT